MVTVKTSKDSQRKMENPSEGIVLYKGKTFCHICQIPVEFKEKQKLNEHVLGPIHHKCKSLFRKFFQVNELNLKCKTCDIELSWLEIEKHRKTHNFIPWEKPILTLFLNSISKIKNQLYYCNLCKKNISQWSDLITHFEDEKHVTLRSENSNFVNMVEKCDLKEDMLYIVITNYTTFLDAENFHCIVCSMKFSKIKEMMRHFDEKEHNKKRGNFSYLNSEKKLAIPRNYIWMTEPYSLKVTNGSDTVYCDYCNCVLKCQGALVKHLQNHFKSLEVVENMFSRYAATLGHLDAEEMQVLREKCFSLDVAQSTPKSEKIQDLQVYISKCRFKVKEEFQWMIVPYKLKFSRDEIFCSHCDVHMKNQGAVDGHLKSHRNHVEEHKKMQKSSEKIEEPKEEKKKFRIPEQYKWMTEPYDLKIFENWVYCGSCGVCFREQQELENHLKIHQEESIPSKVNSHEEIFALDPKKEENLKLCSWSMTTKNGKKFCWFCLNHVRDSPLTIYEHWRTHSNICEHLETKAFTTQLGTVSAMDFMTRYGLCVSPDMTCNLCDERIENLDEHCQKMEHLINKKEHLETSRKLYEDVVFYSKGDWYNTSRFHCEVCWSRPFFEQEIFALHLDSEEHRKNLEKSTGKLIFDNCVPCGILWYGKENSYLEHMDTEEHRKNMQSRKRDFELSEETKELLTRLNSNLTGLLIRSNLVFQETMEKRRGVSKRLEGALEKFFPDGKVYFFGPRTEGLATFENVIDVFFDIDDVYYKGLSLENEKNAKEMIITCLVEARKNWDILEIVEGRRNLTIRAKDLTSDLICDISFKDGIDVENSKTVRKFCDAFPLCHSMILILQQWLSQNDFPANNKVTSWFVIFYLQNMGVFPRITDLISDKKNISGWQTGSIKKIPIAENERSLKDMILGFFVFYSEFKYKENVACPLTGEIVDNELFKNEQQFSVWINNDKVMCLQNPIDLSHNLVESFDKTLVHRFKLLCMKSIELFIQNNF